ncbi:MAG TPA: glycosyltransferase family 4 protein [Candidatus Acidoferrum sp.]|jgi:glycosyltransferase involved in cell wall biosynthesis|nr:glycosyltransferase family 4 protein [Candidatus Acidoferrum sp.]
MVVLEHANRLIERDFDVSLLNIGGEGTLEWFPNNRAQLYSLRTNYPKAFDLVVATGWTTAYKASLLGLQAKRWIYLVQSDESRFVSKDNLEADLARITYHAPYEYVVVAKWMQEWLHRDFGKNALYVPNALNETHMFRTAPIAPRTGQLRVLLEGPIHWGIKGMDDAFAAIKDLDVEVWCISNGKPKRGQRYDRLFQSVPYDQMRAVYSSCDVLLKMSKVESFSYPPLEMMACGGTAVITRFTGHEEYASDEENCFVVDIGDIPAAAKRLRQLSQDRVLLAHLQKNALHTAAQKTGWGKSIDLLQNLFESDPPPAVTPATAFEQEAFRTLALLVDRLVIDFQNNRVGSSLGCLQRLEHLEKRLQHFKTLSGYELLRRFRPAPRS